MSKIYEALLRAELERATNVGAPRQPEALSMDNLLAPVAEEPFPQIEKEDELIREHFAGGIETPAPAVNLHGPLDLSLVPTRIWRPLIAALPALAEHGEGVEQFRILRSRIAEFREQGSVKTVLVSSGLPGEGKSFVAANVALAFARHKGNRVLLIDGDMRRSSLHKILGTVPEPGLTEFLSGAMSLTEVMQRPQISGAASLPAGMSSLVFISGGKDGSKAGDLAASSRFGELIEQAKNTFDWIIVDSSPANLVSDAVNLSHSCDGVLLVGREGVTKFKTAQQAQLQFKTSNILGFVLNAVHKLPAKSDYYGSYEGYKAEAYTGTT